MPKDEHDYGYFGTGSTGYAHYKQTFNETHKNNKNNSQPPQSGCGWMAVVVIAAVVAIGMMFTGANANIAFEAFGLIICGIVFLWMVFK